MEEQPAIWRVAVNILNKQWHTVEKGWSFSLELGEVLTTPHHNNWNSYEHKQVPQTWTDPLVQLNQWKRDMRFSTGYVR